MENSKNKKVEVITLHRIVNYGSVLQAYATQESIKKLGYDVEFIDYYPERMHMFGMLKRIKNKSEKFKKSFILRNIARIIIFPSYVKRFSVFKSFIKNKLNLSKITYLNEQQLRDNLPVADIYCTGSDQVWNSEWNEKIDKVFFLDFDIGNRKKIAYSASFGKKELDNDEIEITRELLSKYNAISLREQSGVDILTSLGLKGTNVVDPTLLLNGEEWRKISSNKFKKDDYILVYNLNRNKRIDKYAENLSRKTGLKVRFLSYQFHEFYKKGKISCNPKVEDFLALIDNAKYIVTDSFHGTAFSLNFNKNFIIVYPEKFSTRLQSILNLLGLENRVAKDETDLEISDRNIDYENINKILAEERKKSLDWLKGALCD